jgi:hypothetical protein
MTRRTYRITLVALPSVSAPMLALRQALKALLRRHGFRCTELREEEPPE